MKVLILGFGMLGKCIVKQTGWDFIDRKQHHFDFTEPITYCNKVIPYDVIVNCVAYTNTYDMNKEEHWNINYKAVTELVNICNLLGSKLVHISTDYLYSGSIENASENDVPVHPANWYGYTKLLADGYVQLKSKNYLLIRSTHKPEPFLYNKAINQKGNFDYVSKISALIVDLIKNDATGLYNVGTETKTMQELALQTKANVEITDELIHPSMPLNTTMNINKLNNFLKNK